MSVETQVNYHVSVEYSSPENRIVIKPPVSPEVFDRLIDEGIISETTASRSWTTDGDNPKTYIPFGRLILGNCAMDEATNRFANELRQHLRTLSTE